MLQVRTFVPEAIAVTVAEGLFEPVIIPDPLVTDQVPVPVNGPGVFPARVTVGLAIQTVCDVPGTEVAGILST